VQSQKPAWSVGKGRPPKKALTGYLFYMLAIKEQVMKENPN